MRFFFVLILAVHALIHLLGFIKAYELTEIKELSMPISKAYGHLWLAGAILILIYTILFFTGYKYAWAAGLIALVVSQCLIFQFWSDARFGTLVNLFILFVSLAGLGGYLFDRAVMADRERILKDTQAPEDVLQLSELDDLPNSVRNWIVSTGAVGKAKVRSAKLLQNFELKLKQGQTDWYRAKAVQYFNTMDPGFVWSLDMNIGGLVNVLGKDRLYRGQGSMLIKLWGLFSMADEKNNEQIDEATMQRFLGELVWLPSALADARIDWKTIDSLSAEATLHSKASSVTGIFRFSETGDFKSFSCMRYMEIDGELKKYKWEVASLETAIKSGVRIPVICEASWYLPDGVWTWARIQVEDIHYNLES